MQKFPKTTFFLGVHIFFALGMKVYVCFRFASKRILTSMVHRTSRDIGTYFLLLRKDESSVNQH